MKKPVVVPISFSQPIRQIVTMLIVCGLVGFGSWIIKDQVDQIMRTNPLLNLFIVPVVYLMAERSVSPFAVFSALSSLTSS